MARLAIFGDTEGRGPIVTGSAGAAVFHIFHGRLVRSALGLVQIGVAGVAAEHLDVNRMREDDVPGIFFLEEDVASMAGGAVGRYAEGCLPVVTAPTGFASLHRFHADVIAVALLFEPFRMAHITVSTMEAVAESDRADGLGLDFDFVHHLPHPHATHSSHAFHANGIQNGRQGNHQQGNHQVPAY